MPEQKVKDLIDGVGVVAMALLFSC